MRAETQTARDGKPVVTATGCKITLQKITGDKSLTIEMTDFLSSPKDEDTGLWLKTIQCLILFLHT